MTTTHTDCIHPKDKAGRTACRRAGGPAAFAASMLSVLRKSAPCEDCFDNALPSAEENYIDYLTEQGGTYTNSYQDMAIVYSWARSYLYDEGALSACIDHQDRL